MAAGPRLLSDARLAALGQCRAILASVGLESLLPGSAHIFSPLGTSLNPAAGSVPHPTVLGTRYIAPPARPFTSHEIERRENRVTRKLAAHAIVCHPLRALVEFPQTGRTSEERILHVFEVDPDDFQNPANDFQYSFNQSHGQDDATTRFLCDNAGNKVACKKRHGRCSSVKTCSFSPVTTVSTSRRVALDSPFHDASRELFLKTVAFYCALMRYGCNFVANEASQTLPDDPNDSDDASQSDYGLPASELDEETDGQPAHESRAPLRRKCSGKLVMFSHDNQYFIKCSLHAPGARGHLLLSGIDQYHIDYLSALMSDDLETCERYEIEAAEQGYGPLHPCEFVTSVRSQARCSDIHRFPDGRLSHGELVVAQDCPARCDVFLPAKDQLSACPRVAVVCSGPHNHPDPARTKTPHPVRALLSEMLASLDWQVADITPRRLVLNGAFMERLKTNLAWADRRLPTLADLHESLGNLDHLAYLINDVRRLSYPDGTGFDAALALLNADTPDDLRYVRAVETRNFRGKDYRFIVCMSPTQSAILLKARNVSIDTAFKRVKGWYELELEAWDDSTHRSITVARVFLNSLTANAHFELFKCLNSIVQTDCGSHICFAYLHGKGWDTLHTDQHKGQAMGLGEFAVWLATETLPSSSPFIQLTPLEHLVYFLMLCIAHYKRNLLKIKCKVDSNIYSAMLSLSSSEPLPDLDSTLALIRSGPPVAQTWLEDKITGSPFALPALYQPKSKIPRTVWKAAPRTTNGNEQAHRSVNRDGTQLSLLAGIERGFQHDWRLLASRETYVRSRIHTRYQVPDLFRRSLRNLRRHDNIHEKKMATRDEELSAALAQAERPIERWRSFQTAAASVDQSEASTKRARDLYEAAAAAEERVRKLARFSSGRVRVPDPQTFAAEPTTMGNETHSAAFSCSSPSFSGPPESWMPSPACPSPPFHAENDMPFEAEHSQGFSHVAVWAIPEPSHPSPTPTHPSQCPVPSSFDIALGLDSDPHFSRTPSTTSSYAAAQHSQPPMVYPPGYMPTAPSQSPLRDPRDNARNLLFDVQEFVWPDKPPRL